MKTGLFFMDHSVHVYIPLGRFVTVPDSCSKLDYRTRCIRLIETPGHITRRTGAANSTAWPDRLAPVGLYCCKMYAAVDTGG